MRVCLGGTFDILHRGHEKLLGRAFEIGDEGVVIGITSDAMASRTRRSVNPLAVRRRNLTAFLRRRGWTPYEIAVLEDIAGPAAYEADLDAILVTAETVRNAGAINAERVGKGHRPMEVVVVPFALAEDCTRIAAHRIRAGEIDRQGRMRRPLVVRVGSRNQVKVEAARRAFGSVFRSVRVRGMSADAGVPAQPFDNETVQGALARARAALGRGDYGVGIEAGLVWSEAAGDYLDVQFCAIADKRGVSTVGHGPGFRYPPAVIESVKGGRSVGEAMEEIAGVRGLGRKEGAIGWLSRGAMDRRRLTESAVLMALLPRIRRDFYFE